MQISYKNKYLTCESGAALVDMGVLVASISLVGILGISGLGMDVREYVFQQTSHLISGNDVGSDARGPGTFGGARGPGGGDGYDITGRGNRGGLRFTGGAAGDSGGGSTI